MKRFSKVLFSIIALVAIVTVFAVVALATEEEPAIEASAATLGMLDGTFESYEHGQQIQNSSSKKGKFTVIKQDVDNKYVFIEYEDGSGSNAENLDFDWTTRLIAEYKYISLDFDVMSPDGGNSAGLYFRLRDTNYKSGKTGYDLNLGTKISFSSMGISTTPYDWQHVTAIVEMLDDFSFDYHIYINGEFVKTINDTKWQAKLSADGFDISKLSVNYARILSQGSASSARNAVDNICVTHYKEGATLDQIANYYYKNGEYALPYKYTVATITDSEGAVTYFDDIDKAIAAANEDDKVQLYDNITEPIVINKPITVDANIYSTDAETGETTVTGTYEFNWGSTKGYVAEVQNGIHTITLSDSLVTVKWDAPCAEDCDCVGNHQLNSESIVVLGQTPEYFYDIPTIPEVKGIVTSFLGWSYENDGTVDTLVPITADDVATGTLNLYPVYKQTQYDFSLNVNGTLTYHTADEYATIFNTAEATTGSVVTLLRDAEVYDQITLDAGKTITFDLRGNTLTRINLIGNTFHKNAGTGVYAAGDARTSVGSWVFYTNTKNTGLTITSSADEMGTVKTYKVTADIYYDENGKMERYEATSVSNSHFLHFYNSANYKLNVYNVNVYAARFLYASGGSNSNFQFNVDNCNYYETASSVAADMKNTYTFYFESNSSFTANITNSLFYYQENLSPTNVFLRCHGKNGGVHNVTVENCDIIALTAQDIFNFYSSDMTTVYLTTNVQFNNCRLYNTSANLTYTTYLGDDTLYTSTMYKDSTTTVSAGYVSTPATKTLQYTVPVTTAPVIDSETKQAGFSVDTTTIEVSFAYEVQKCSEVPESFTGVKLSILYYTNFNIALYVPVQEKTTITSLTGFAALEGTVKIDGKDYYVYVKESDTVSVSDTVAAKMSYTVDDKEYKQTFNTGALVYADMVLNKPLSDVESKAIANMVRYIKEARLASSLAAGAEFDELIALGNLADLGAKEDYADESVDYSDLSSYVKGVKFMIDGTNAAYVITLTDSAVTENATLSLAFANSKAAIALRDSATPNTKYTTNTRVYDIAANAIEITVTVPAAEEGAEPTVITGTYSVKAYINATDNALAKAMYEFGVAAKAYREYLETL